MQRYYFPGERQDGGAAAGAELHLTPPLQGVKHKGFLGVLSLRYAFVPVPPIPVSPSLLVNTTKVNERDP